MPWPFTSSTSSTWTLRVRAVTLRGAEDVSHLAGVVAACASPAPPEAIRGIPRRRPSRSTEHQPTLVAISISTSFSHRWPRGIPVGGASGRGPVRRCRPTGRGCRRTSEVPSCPAATSPTAVPRRHEPHPARAPPPDPIPLCPACASARRKSLGFPPSLARHREFPAQTRCIRRSGGGHGRPPPLDQALCDRGSAFRDRRCTAGETTHRHGCPTPTRAPPMHRPSPTDGHHTVTPRPSNHRRDVPGDGPRRPGAPVR